MLVQLVQVRPWVVIALSAIVALVCLAGFIALVDGHHSDLAAADCFRGCSRVGCRHDWGSSLSPAASRGRDGWPPASAAPVVSARGPRRLWAPSLAVSCQ